jgi:hypothetical protein
MLATELRRRVAPDTHMQSPHMVAADLVCIMIRAALALAALGVRIFPCWSVLDDGRDGFICGCGSLRCTSPGKHPMARLAPRGCLDATSDLGAAEHLWRCAPEANIGIATGDGLVVVDVDPRHGGEETLAALIEEHGPLPQTWRVATGGGGVHFYFTSSVNVPNSTGRVGPGIDVRGRGGFVIAPPSNHASGGSYRWTWPCNDPGSIWQQLAATQRALLPDWLLAAMQRPTTGVGAPVGEWRELVRDGIGEGGRNDAVTRLAGHLLRRYVDPFVVLELLLSWNSARCRPPLDEGDVAGIVDRIAGLELKRRSMT